MQWQYWEQFNGAAVENVEDSSFKDESSAVEFRTRNPLLVSSSSASINSDSAPNHVLMMLLLLMSSSHCTHCKEKRLVGD